MKTSLGKLTILSLIFNVLLTVFFLAKRYYYSHSGSSTETAALIDQWNDSRSSELKTLKGTEPNALKTISLIERRKIVNYSI